jgi:hypothetical protein
MSQYRCIYCGVSIPPDTGLSCPSCSKKSSSFKDYDKEFAYSDEIESNVAKIMSETEQRSLSQSSQQVKEEYLRLYEGNLATRKEFRWEKQEELQKKREGRILHMNEFLRLLKKALPDGFNAWYTDKGGMANTLGLFIGHPTGTALLPSCSHAPGEPHYIGFVQVPRMQEFEELHFDRYMVPLGSKRRGWRTIGLRLIEAGIISEKRFHEVFGEPPTGEVSRRYLHYLKYIRSLPQQKSLVEIGTQKQTTTP